MLTGGKVATWSLQATRRGFINPVACLRPEYADSSEVPLAHRVFSLHRHDQGKRSIPRGETLFVNRANMNNRTLLQGCRVRADCSRTASAHTGWLSGYDPRSTLARDAIHHDASSTGEVTAQIGHRIIQSEAVNQCLQRHQLALAAFVTAYVDTVVVILDILERCRDV
jgi:hypothetical protein